jgi:hypothetical protein
VRLDKWFSPVLFSLQGLVILWNAGAGLFSLWKHHYVFALINFGGAACIGSVVYFTHWSRKRHEATTRRIRQELAEFERRRVMPDSEQLAADTKAKANLELVMKATCATFYGAEGAVTVPIEGYDYIVVSGGYVHKRRNGLTVGATCIHFSNTLTPAPEFIASVILLLKHDPSIFDRWKRQDNYYA